jgi:hypothetical protein
MGPSVGSAWIRSRTFSAAMEEDAALLERVDARDGVELAHIRSMFDVEVRQAMPEASCGNATSMIFRSRL